MESIEDDLILPIPDEPPSPIYKSKLKRLKKSSSSATADPVKVSDAPILPDQDSNESAASESKDPDGKRDFGDDLGPLFSVPSDDPIIPSSDSGSKEVGGEKEVEDDLDPLFSVPAIDEGFETLDLEREREEDGGFKKIGEIGSGIEEKSEKKRFNLDEGSEEILKKRRKKKSKDGDKLGEKPKESVREKKRTEKERMAMLEHMHAESQRLLRETRDASFKPVPVVQKPISSVLEKIRLRKLEVLKQTSILCQLDSIFTSDCSVDEIVEKNSDLVKIQNHSRDNVGDSELDNFASVQAAGSNRSPQDPCEKIPCNNASDLELKDASPTSISEAQASDMELKDASPTAIGEAQEATKNNQSKYGDNSQSDDLEESSNPPLPTSVLNPISDDLSSEEDDDKENSNPRASSAVSVDSSPECGLAKVFLDDEADEEDDSDNDLARFQDNEEDNESDEDEVFDDLIATGYKEGPIDHDKRNQLHQKWLEQQDAAGTDDILQRLKYGRKQKEPTCLLDYDDNDDDDAFDEESADEKSHDPPVADIARQNSKKAKQMIAQMFNDADNSYVHSDDEESEQTLHHQRILKQTGESSFISPVEDEHSREVFGLIKKLNIVPVTKKRGKTVTSSFDSPVMGANSNSASRSSFLNRTTSTSVPSLHRQASTTVRAFIFGRDDSNSRSGISASESISDMDPKDNHSVKPAASKVNSSSQFRSTAKTKIEANSSTASGSSLFQILRQSSVQFDKQSSKKRTSYQEVTETQAAHQFSAFKLGKGAAKVESRI